MLFKILASPISSKALWGILLFTNLSSAAIGDSKGIHFFKTPQSLFPSGQSHRRLLEKAELREEWKYSFLVQHQQKKFWLQSQDILRDLDLASTAISENDRVQWRIQKKEGAWLQVKNPKTGQITWLSQRELRPDPKDLGLAVNLISTSLRQGPKWESELRVMIPPLSSLRLIQMKNNWAYVSFESVGEIQGWVDLSSLVLKADFASFAQLKDGRWRPIKYRENDQLILDKDDRIDISEAEQLITRPDQAIIVRKISGFDIPLRSTVSILKIDADRWGLSSLPGHGLVYWKKNMEDSVDFTALGDSEHLKTEELLRREITAVAFHPKDPLLGLVSAGGVYFTKNGEDWTLLSGFREQNQPVSFGPQGQWIVGSSWSRDQGKTFQSFVSWDKLGSLLMTQSSVSPKVLKLTDVKPLDNQRLRLLVDTGTGQYSFVADVDGSRALNWRLDPTIR